MALPGLGMRVMMCTVAMRARARRFELAAIGAASVSDAHRVEPDVLGAQRLFSAWLEGQILYRHLPGIAVGVVADQELIWAAGFGFADTGKKVADDAADQVPHGVAQQAVHRHGHHAAARARASCGSTTRSPKYLPWFQVKTAESEDPPITIEELLTHSSGLAARSGRRTGRRSSFPPRSSCAG